MIEEIIGDEDGGITLMYTQHSSELKIKEFLKGNENFPREVDLYCDEIKILRDFLNKIYEE